MEWGVSIVKEVFLGEVIRQRRLELGLTQEELCEGICEPMTISRFENGRQTPSRNRTKALFQRLGLPDDRFYGLLSAKELEISNLEKEITSCHVRFVRAAPEEKNRIREETFIKHRELERVIDKDDTLSRQLILRSKFLLGTENGPYSLDEGLPMLLEAMHLTSPRFDLDSIGRGLYTENEIKLINNMANCYIRAERHYDAIDILKPLLRYLQTKLKNIPPNRAQIPMVAFNYARELEIVKRFDDAIEIAEYARRICIDYGVYTSLSGVLMILAECYYHQGNREKSVELYHQAYYLFKIIEDEDNLAIIKIEAKKFLGLELN